MSAQRIDKIRAGLTIALQPTELEVTDEGHKHVGHEGAKSGKGHFHVRIAAKQFQGLSPIHRHRLIYAAIEGLMETDIHALSIEATTPTEK